MAQDENSNTQRSHHSGPDSGYLAEYYRHCEDKVPNSYIVMFKEGHTLAKHIEFLGKSFEMLQMAENRGYSAEHIDDSFREQIRKDPGVKFIEDSFNAEDDWVDDDDE